MHLFYLKALSNTQPLLPCTPPKPFIRTNKITKPLVINHAPLNHLLCLRPAVPGSPEQKPGDGMEASRIISPHMKSARIVFAPILPVYKPIRDCQKSVPARLSILIKTEFSLF